MTTKSEEYQRLAAIREKLGKALEDMGDGSLVDAERAAIIDLCETIDMQMSECAEA